VQGRQQDIGAFDTPKHAGLPLGHVARVGVDHLEVELDEGVGALNNGDAITWFDLQQELRGVPVNTAEPLDASGRRFRVVPKDPLSELKDLRRGTVLMRNRDMAWDRLLRKKSSDRRVAVDLHLEETREGFALSVTDEDGHHARVELAHAHEAAQQPERAEAACAKAWPSWAPRSSPRGRSRWPCASPGSCRPGRSTRCAGTPSPHWRPSAKPAGSAWRAARRRSRRCPTPRTR
jgi:putative protease